MRIILILSALCFAAVFAAERLLVLNALGWNNDTALHALDTVLESAEVMYKTYPEHWTNLTRKTLFIQKGALSSDRLNGTRIAYLKDVLGIELNVLEGHPWRSLRRGEFTRKVEHISAILEALHRSLQGIPAEDRSLVSISSTAKSLAVPMPNFFDLFGAVQPPYPYKVALPAKSGRFTTASDWHDLQVLALRLDYDGMKWVGTMREVLHNYARRRAFRMLEPRPAIMEANHLLGRDKVFFMDEYRLCFSQYSLKDDEMFPTVAVHTKQLDVSCPHYTPAAELSAANETVRVARRYRAVKESGVDYYGHYVHLLYDKADVEYGRPVEGIEWRNSLSFSESGERRYRLAQKLSLHKSRWGIDLPHAMRHGSLRFRTTTSRDVPSTYCWHEEPATDRSHRRFSFWSALTGSGSQPQASSQSKPHTHSPDSDLSSTSTPRSAMNTSSSSSSVQQERVAAGDVLMLTSAYGRPSSIDQYMYNHIAKMYYARHHGHQFFLGLSNRMATYLPPNLFELAGVTKGKLLKLRNIAAKVVQVLDSMYIYPNAQWVFYTEGNVDMNAKFLNISLTSYLDDVPQDKVFVAANHAMLTTTAFFMRNSERGRSFLRDWLSVLMSGFVTCSAFDKASLQVLLLLRQLPQDQWNTSPLGFQCLPTNGTIKQRSATSKPVCEVADKHFSPDKYTCDRSFAATLHDLGFLVPSSKVSPPTQSLPSQNPSMLPVLAREGSAAGMGAVNATNTDTGATPDKATLDGTANGPSDSVPVNTKAKVKPPLDPATSLLRGCANSVLQDVHISTETTTRPRLHCTYCGHTDEVLSNAPGVHGGGMGGGNDLVRVGAIDGWLTNYKANWLFHEQWLNKKSCSPMHDFPPICGDTIIAARANTGGGEVRGEEGEVGEMGVGRHMEEGSNEGRHQQWTRVRRSRRMKNDNVSMKASIIPETPPPQFLPLWGNPSRREVYELRRERKENKNLDNGAALLVQMANDDVVGVVDDPRAQLLSLVDGLALNLETGMFCRVESRAVKRHQRLFTYMREYRQAINIVRRLSDDEWWARYRLRGGGEARMGARCLKEDIGKRGDDIIESGDWPPHLIHPPKEYICQDDGFLWRAKPSHAPTSSSSNHKRYRTKASGNADALPWFLTHSCDSCTKRKAYTTLPMSPLSVSLDVMDCSTQSLDTASHQSSLS